jgi:hypothetical protein
VDGESDESGDEEGSDDDEDLEGDGLPPRRPPNLSACAVQARELAPFLPAIRHGGGGRRGAGARGRTGG